MSAKITYFPVGNGDMTLIETEKGKKILIDCNIRDNDEHPDVATMLRDRLERDSENRLFVDLFIWSHPDQDHCGGIKDNFHLGDPEGWDEDDDLIMMHEIWSSPTVYRRASKKLTFCKSAKELKKEVKRRIKNHEDDDSKIAGNYVQILCEDEDGKSDGVYDLVLDLDDSTSYFNGQTDSSITATLLGPSPTADLDEDEDKLGKNHSSVMINFEISANQGDVKAKFLSGGDAEVVCWEALLDRMDDNETTSNLEYDILLAPHHCSWHSLSHESWSEKKKAGETAVPSDKALEALGYALPSAIIVSSSDEISEEDSDPPSHAAMDEYEKILDDVDGTFKCVSDNIKDNENVPLVIEITGGGIKIRTVKGLAATSAATNEAVNRDGGDGYA